MIWEKSAGESMHTNKTNKINLGIIFLITYAYYIGDIDSFKFIQNFTNIGKLTGNLNVRIDGTTILWNCECWIVNVKWDLILTLVPKFHLGTQVQAKLSFANKCVPKRSFGTSGKDRRYLPCPVDLKQRWVYDFYQTYRASFRIDSLNIGLIYLSLHISIFSTSNRCLR